MDINCTGHLKAYKQKFNRIKSKISFCLQRDQYQPILPKGDKYYYRNDWASLLFRALLVYKKQYKGNVHSFCTIGTGVGLDTLAAVESLDPREILLTDSMPNIALLAKRNVNKCLKKRKLYNINYSESFLFNDEKAFQNRKFDLIYENLSNLSEESLEDTIEPYFSASFTETRYFEDVPQIYKNHLLFTHYKFLEEAKSFLTPNGRVICNIGARVDKNLIFKMFRDLQYEPVVLVFDLKRQTEAATNIPAYAKYEKQNSIEISFYSYSNELFKDIKEIKGYDKLSGFANDMNNKDYRSIIDSIRHSASSANKIYPDCTFAHEVLTILGIPK